MQHPPSSLDNCIQPITKTIDSQRIVIHSLNFNLDPSLLQQIQHQQHRQQPLALSTSLCNTLRQYSLTGEQGHLQTGLTFYTYLHHQPIIKSYIAFDGEIIHQIHQDCLDPPALASAVFQAHQWLIEQILTQMSWRRTHLVQRLSWVIAGLLIIVSLFFLPPILWLLTPLVWWLLQRGIQFLLGLTGYGLQ